MKRVLKPLCAIIAVLLISVITVVVSFAEAENEPAYTITYWKKGEEGNVTTISGANGEDFQDKFNSIALNPVRNNCGYVFMIKLGKDITDAQYSVRLPRDSEVYFDLAGHKYATYGGVSSSSMFQTSYTAGSTKYNADNSNIYFYSSEPGGGMFLASYDKSSSSVKGHAVVVLSSENTTVNFGEATVDGVTYDGDNLSVYTSMLVDANQKASVKNTLNIKGGAYHRIAKGAVALITNRSSMTVNIEDALLYANSDRIFSFGTSSEYVSDGTINVKDSVIYSTSSSVVIAYYNDTASLYLENCYINANMGIGENAVKGTLGTVRYKDCYFTNSSTIKPIGDQVIAKACAYKDVSLFTNKFSFDFTYNEDGTVKSATMAPSSLVLTDISFQLAFLNMVTTPENTVNVTWVSEDKTVSEVWAKGETPYAPTSLPADTDVYKYSFGEISPATEDATYTAKAYVNFPVKANISLYTDFVYNIYIPTEYTEHINSVTIGGKTVDLSECEIVENAGVEYVRIVYGIYTSVAANSFSLVLNVDGYNGVAFDQVYTLSIPSYAATVLSGSYNEEAKDLMRTTLSYIRSALIYANKYNGELDSIDGLINASVPTDLTAPTEAPEDFLKIFKNAQLSITDKISFRFNVCPDVTSATAEFTYPINGVMTTVVITEEDFEGESGAYYYDVVMRARDLATPVEVKVGNSVYKFSVGNYVYAVNNYLNASNTERYEELLTFVNNIWAYSKAAKSYRYSAVEIDLSINNNPITEYDIVAVGETEFAMAEILRDAIYARAGVTLPIVDTLTAGKRSIEITLKTGLDKREYSSDFEVYEDAGNLVVRCEYESFALDGMTSFVKENITALNDDTNIAEGYSVSYNTDKIYYADFGAAGNAYLIDDTETLSYVDTDNVTKTITTAVKRAVGENDFAAIYRTHEAANATMRHTVYATPGAVYYISDTRINGMVKTVTILTNTVWTDAEFIIDDTNLRATSSSYGGQFDDEIFRVAPTTPSFSINSSEVLAKLSGVGPATKKIDIGLDYGAMLVLYNSSKKVYIRFGGNANSGSNQHELVVVDKDGNIKEGTELLLDYAKVTSITVYKEEPTELTIKGGVVTTLASRMDTRYYNESGTLVKNDDYFGRCLEVARSNTRVIGLEHKVYNEFDKTEQSAGFTGAAYHGFFSAENANGVTFENCIMTARRYYNIKGTYGFSGTLVNDIVLKNCTQSNFYKADGVTLSTSGSEYWGLGGTNYCKNMVYDSCKITRYDAHSGVYNGKIINSELAMVNLIGGGTMLIEDSRIIDSQFFRLRADYGSTWKGVVVIRNTTLVCHNSSPRILSMTWANHDFGYTTYFPNLVLDGVKMENKLSKKIQLLIKGDYSYDKKDSKDTVDYAYEYGNYQDGIHLDTLKEHYNKDGVIEENVPNKNPMVPPSYIKIFNNTNGVTFDFSTEFSYDFFKNTRVIDYTGKEFNDFDSPLVDYN